MQSLAERHASRIQRKAENSKGVELGGNPNEEKNTFVEGEDGFSRAGIGVVNPNFVNSVPSDQVNDTFGQIDPVVGAEAQAGVDAAEDAAAAAEAEGQQAAGWGASGGSAGTSAQAGNGGDAAAPEGASVEGTTKGKAAK